MNRRINTLLAISLSLGILTMTPANATNHREVMTSVPIRELDPIQQRGGSVNGGGGERSPAANVLAPSAQPQPRLGRWRGACSTWRYGETLTPAIYQADPERGKRIITRLIRCEFDRWAPGQADTAVMVATRESGLYPWSQNVSSLCSGLFQHILSAWNGRATTFLHRWEYANWVPPWTDARANAEIAAKMVAAGGWGPWSTA